MPSQSNNISVDFLFECSISYLERIEAIISSNTREGRIFELYLLVRDLSRLVDSLELLDRHGRVSKGFEE
jgi:hypothetical protein